MYFVMLGKPKPLHFKSNRHLFTQFDHKIIHVIVEEMLHEVVTEPKHVWENEYFSRNQVARGLRVAGAREGDVLLLCDTDEILHPRAIHSLKALFTQTNGIRHGRAERVYKLHPYEFMYHFDCYVGQNDVLKAGAATATTVGFAKRQLALTKNSADNDYISLTRMYRQTVFPYPLENILYPGSWHLSFFGGVERIKSKLQSYSHQNFVRQFVDCGDECISSGDPIYDQNGVEIIPTTLPEGDISTNLIADKIARGQEIDNRNRRTCNEASSSHVYMDGWTHELREMWEKGSANR